MLPLTTEFKGHFRAEPATSILLIIDHSPTFCLEGLLQNLLIRKIQASESFGINCKRVGNSRFHYSFAVFRVLILICTSSIDGLYKLAAKQFAICLLEAFLLAQIPINGISD